MKVGVIIPDRNDRQKFLEHCKFMLSKQTMQPTFIEVVNFVNPTNNFDLTQRVRIGFDRLKNICDCVLIIENDDYYSENYIETMVNTWIELGKPELLGTDYTYYYHVFKKQYRKLVHKGRASLMNTLINTNLNVNWCDNNEVYLDLHIWKKHNGMTFTPEVPIAVGIKHGIGLCGGNGHNGMQFQENDFDLQFLKSIVDKESFNFYKSL